MNELKPCPFCGGEPILRKERAEHNLFDYFTIRCFVCSAEGVGSIYKIEAVTKWNTRHYDDAPAYVRKLQLLDIENANLIERYENQMEQLRDQLGSLEVAFVTQKAQLDKTTALYSCACERAEMLEKARDGWAEKYEAQQSELNKLYKLLRATHCRFHEAIVDLERNGYAISQDSTN